VALRVAGFSRLFLPYAEGLTTQALFGVVYGLDWVATVPPTAGLASDLFGQRSGSILFGWIFFGHQGGAAVAMVVHDAITQGPQCADARRRAHDGA
jgi:hypothetical protein